MTVLRICLLTEVLRFHIKVMVVIMYARKMEAYKLNRLIVELPSRMLLTICMPQVRLRNICRKRKRLMVV